MNVVLPNSLAPPTPTFERKTGRWRPRVGEPSGKSPLKTAHFVPQNNFFWPKTAPEPIQNDQTKRNGAYTSCAP